MHSLGACVKFYYSSGTFEGLRGCEEGRVMMKLLGGRILLNPKHD